MVGKVVCSFGGKGTGGRIWHRVRSFRRRLIQDTTVGEPGETGLGVANTLDRFYIYRGRNRMSGMCASRL